jgi:hypothetical protein
VNDRDFENLLATEFAKPLKHEPSPDLAPHILARADNGWRLRHLVVAGAATVGGAVTIGMVTTFASLDAVARALARLLAALPGVGIAPVAALCLVLTLAVGLRSRVV